MPPPCAAYLLARAQCAEVLRRLGHHVGAELNDDAASGRAADRDVVFQLNRHL